MLESTEKWELARGLAGDMVARSRLETPIGLIVFASKFHNFAPLSSDHQPVFQTIREMSDLQERQTGTTPLTKTLFEAIAMLLPTQPGDVVYLVRDGEDNQSRETVADIQKALRSREIRLYATLFWSSHRPSINAEDFQNVAKNTAGFVVDEAALSFQDGPFSWKERYDVAAAHRASLASAADLLYEQILGAYRIEVQTAPSALKAKRLNVDVVDADGRRQKGATVSYPKEVAACVWQK